MYQNGKLLTIVIFENLKTKNVYIIYFSDHSIRNTKIVRFFKGDK